MAPTPPPWDDTLPRVTVPEIDRCLRRGVSDKVFSGASCLASSRGVVFHRATYGQAQMPPPLQRMAARPLFDLGALTRVLGTHVAVLSLMGRGRLDMSAPIGRVLKDFATGPLADVPIDLLLDHTSGLPADTPLWEALQATDKRAHPQDRRLGTAKAVPEMRRLLAALPLAAEPGTVTCASNLGFMVLGWVVEAVTGKALDTYLHQSVYTPLDIAHLLLYVRLPADPRAPKRAFVATELCPWRNKLMVGEVQDHNAWAMGGVAGHAGLFGTAEAVWRLAQTLLDATTGKNRIFHGGTLGRLWTRSKRVANTSRTLGWDSPGRDNGMLNARFGSASVGETSPIGTAVWIDPVQNTVAVWLTNAAHPTLDGKEAALTKLRLRYFELAASYATQTKPQNPAGRPDPAALINRLKKPR